MGKSKAEIIWEFALGAWVLLFAACLLAFRLWLLCSDTVNGLLFGVLVQGTGTTALQTGSSGLNYLQPDPFCTIALFIGELGAALLTVLAASGLILRLKPKEILTRMR